MNDPFMDEFPESQCRSCKEKNKEYGDNDYYPDTLLMGVAERLPGDWEKLGVYLGLSRTILDSIHGNQRNKVESWALRMFKLWWDGAEPLSRWTDLHEALSAVYRKDLIVFTREFFRKNEMDPQHPDERKIQLYFQAMAEQVPREWKDIGIYLYVPTAKLETIQLESTDPERKNRSYEVLISWKQGKHGSWTDLTDVLKKMGRLDIVKYINDEIEKYCENCRRTWNCGDGADFANVRGPPSGVYRAPDEGRPQMHQPPSHPTPYFQPSQSNISQPQHSRVLAPNTSVSETARMESIHTSLNPSSELTIPEQSTPERTPSLRFAAENIDSVSPPGSNPSFHGVQPTEAYAEATAQSINGTTQRIRNLHLDETSNGPPPANTMSDDLVIRDTDNTDY